MDSYQYYYAVAQGYSEEVAKNRALGEVANRISVSIRAQLTDQQTKSFQNDQSIVTGSIESKVSATSKQIDFTQVQVVKKSTTANGDIQVLIKVDRQALYDNQFRQFNELNSKISREAERALTAEIFYKLKVANQISALIDKAKEKLVIVKAINPDVDDTAYYNQYTNYQNDFAQASENAVIGFKYDANSKSLVELLKKYLSQDNFKLGQQNANVIIEVSTDAKERSIKTSDASLKNLTFVERATIFKVKSANGNVISSHVVKTKASSSQGFDDAVQQIKAYDKMIREQGALPFVSGQG
ncbi:hypothetical protein ACMZOO_09260 [Catenovulum sp. SX2]|uniref:hypothetical protein n=1 Tax=Catenovulum sp. SX2 TaxID=3398614 RepID=UPI003F874859